MSSSSTASEIARRKRWMGVLAQAELGALRALLAAAPALPDYAALRAAEAGMVMVRGRAGGTGARFNLGEMTVTRCSVRDAAGRVGHAYVAGRHPELALLAARVDAAMQDPGLAEVLEAAVIGPLAAARDAAREADARRAAATKVDFFTMSTMRS